MHFCTCSHHAHSETDDTTTTTTSSCLTPSSSTVSLQDPITNYCHHHNHQVNPSCHSHCHHHKQSKNPHPGHHDHHHHQPATSTASHHRSIKSRLSRRNTHHHCPPLRKSHHKCPHKNHQISQNLSNTSSTLSSSRHSLPTALSILPPLHVSVNLRYGSTDRVLLRDDVFIPVSASHTLLDHFRTALERQPTQVGRYVLRKDKNVIVIGKDKESVYAKTSAIFVSITKVRPSRLIFCVHPNVEVMRELDQRKTYNLAMNARRTGCRKYVLHEDILIDTTGNATVSEVWNAVQEKFDELASSEVLGLHTVRPYDHVGLRFSCEDIVADIVKSGGRRFVFVLGNSHGTFDHIRDHHQQDTHEKRIHQQHKRHEHSHHRKHDHHTEQVTKSGVPEKLQSLFRFRQEPRKHRKRALHCGGN